MQWLGVVTLGFYLLHAIRSWSRGRFYNAFWLCHMAAVVLGVGLMAGSPVLTGIGVLWLLVGVPLWFVDLAMGGDFTWTSLLTHLGSAVSGATAILAFGMPRQVWWIALLGVGCLYLLCRAATPPAANVNLAFAVHRGWERWFPSYVWYVGLLAAMLSGIFYLANMALFALYPAPSAGIR